MNYELPIEKRPPRFYCPESLDLENMLRGKHDYWIKHIWKLYHILTVVYRARWQHAKYRMNPEGYVPINRRFLENVIGPGYTTGALNVLLSLGILESDNQYLVGAKSKGYRYCEPFRKIKFREVNGLNLEKVNQSLWAAPIQLEDGNPVHSFLFDNLRRVSLDDGVADV